MTYPSTPIEHLGVVEELARNSAPYSEFRMHLIAVHEALESFAALQLEHTKLNEAKSKVEFEADAKYKELMLRYLELKPHQSQPQSDSSWPFGGTGLIHKTPKPKRAS